MSQGYVKIKLYFLKGPTVYILIQENSVYIYICMTAKYLFQVIDSF